MVSSLGLTFPDPERIRGARFIYFLLRRSIFTPRRTCLQVNKRIIQRHVRRVIQCSVMHEQKNSLFRILVIFFVWQIVADGITENLVSIAFSTRYAAAVLHRAFYTDPPTALYFQNMRVFAIFVIH